MCLNCGENPACRYSKYSSGKFCSKKCARSYATSEDRKAINKIVSEKLSGRSGSGSGPQKCELIIKRCSGCNKLFTVSATNRDKSYCSRSCFEKWWSISDEKLEYRKRCQFEFNVWNYPEWFDLNLINRLGWYKPSNKGNNLDGVSRDHMFSIKQGWELSIDPYLLSHPANCQLLSHKQNNSKNSNCSVSLKKLKRLIICFHNIYGPVAESG